MFWEINACLIQLAAVLRLVISVLLINPSRGFSIFQGTSQRIGGEGHNCFLRGGICYLEKYAHSISQFFCLTLLFPQIFHFVFVCKSFFCCPGDRSLPEVFKLFDLIHVLTTDHKTVSRITKEV